MGKDLLTAYLRLAARTKIWYAADPDGAIFRDWLFDDGFFDEQLDSVIDLGLVRYIERDFIPSPEEFKALYDDIFSIIDGFELTDLGKK